jgi:hypothetical protein
MLVYLNEISQQDYYSKIPMALRERHASDLENRWATEYKLRFLGYGPGTLRVDISGSTEELVRMWLADAGIACVDLEAADILPFFGNKKDPITLGLVDVLRTDPNVQAELSRLTVDEIEPALERLAWRALQTTDVSDFDAKVATERMRAAGIKVSDADDFLNPPPPEPLSRITEADLAEFGVNQPKPLDDLFAHAQSDLEQSTGGW